MVATCNKKIMLKIILVSEKELSDINFERLKKALVYINNNLIDSDSNIYLDFDLLADINNIVTGWNNITLRTVNVEPYGHEKIYTDKDLIEDRLSQLINHLLYRNICILDNIHSVYDENGKTCKILFVFNK